ncbi:hypothetical protein FDG2_2439 [Candidatus Protofrankia californiensis]|uniref:Polysaccharide biosynthesis protein n=1 Tax=Candidatus Protofrankia californiensis TaxID=1839754 RepID=A0A1C3NXK7_9ACTN|nr:hypothetical protein FDG2_2439 [Candidatus Protofrankia californiensis]
MKVARRAVRQEMSAGPSVLESRNTDATLFVAQLFAMMTGVVVARILGPAGRGTVTALATWAQFLGWIGIFSVDKALIIVGRDLGADREPARLRQLASVAVTTMRPVTAASLVGALGLGGVLFPVLLPLFLVLVVLTILQEFQSGLMLLAGNYQRYLVLRCLQPLIYAVLIAVVAAVPGIIHPHGVVAVVCCIVFSFLTVVLFGPSVPRPWVRLQRAVIGKRLTRLTREIQLATTMQYLNNRLDLLVAPLILARDDVGWYAVGASVGQLLGFLGTANALRGLVGRSAGIDVRGTLVVATIACVGAAFASHAVPLVFGAGFAPAVPVAQVLLLGGVAAFCLQGCTWRLVGATAQRAAAASQGLGAVVFALGVAVEPTMIGLAWANALSTLVALAAGEMLWHRHCRGASLRNQYSEAEG